jgi:nucleotide-binding universal stress UspA family protein
MNFKRILVPVDYSEHSKNSLEYAASLAERFGASLDVVHVWDRPAYVSDTVVVVREGESRSLAEMIHDNAEREMRDFLAPLQMPKGVVVSERLLSGEPASVLLEELGKGEYDLVVVGTHGRTGLQHLILGSIAEKLVRMSPVPVLTIPRPKS